MSVLNMYVHEEVIEKDEMRLVFISACTTLNTERNNALTAPSAKSLTTEQVVSNISSKVVRGGEVNKRQKETIWGGNSTQKSVFQYIHRCTNTYDKICSTLHAYEPRSVVALVVVFAKGEDAKEEEEVNESLLAPRKLLS